MTDFRYYLLLTLVAVGVAGTAGRNDVVMWACATALSLAGVVGMFLALLKEGRR